MPGVEINFVVSDCIAALPMYEIIFEIQDAEATDVRKGGNEAVFTIYGAKFRMLDENEEFNRYAPKKRGNPLPIWISVTVPDIAAALERAVSVGCAVIQPVADIAESGAKNAIFSDPFNYVWLIREECTRC
ncbi:MAG: VOC family protein [Defluviitaleaceae bacterium]|nr:VOC family protein [Defluviitaleaceae bacterium]